MEDFIFKDNVIYNPDPTIAFVFTVKYPIGSILLNNFTFKGNYLNRGKIINLNVHSQNLTITNCKFEDERLESNSIYIEIRKTETFIMRNASFSNF